MLQHKEYCNVSICPSLAAMDIANITSADRVAILKRIYLLGLLLKY